MKAKIQKKTVTFAGKSYTLFSLDGSTWSTNADELPLIVERLRAQRESVKDSLNGVIRSQVAAAPQDGAPEEEAKPAVSAKAAKPAPVATAKPKAKSQKAEVVAAPVKKVQEKLKAPVANKRASSKPRKQAEASKRTVAKSSGAKRSARAR